MYKSVMDTYQHAFSDAQHYGTFIFSDMYLGFITRNTHTCTPS